MKKNKFDKVLDQFPSICVPYYLDKKTSKAIGCKESYDKFGVRWSCKGHGFGEFWFWYDPKKKKTICDNEYSDKNFIKLMLCKMVDDCILQDK